MNCTLLDTGKITIRNFVLIGSDVKIYTAVHQILPDERIYADETDKKAAIWIKTVPVTVGNRMRIGGGAVILAGVTISDNAVIGAGSMVTKSIPANTVAYGNPCTVKKMLNKYVE